MASALLQQLQERQGSLVDALIQQVFGFQADDPNLNTVRDYCTYNLSPRHHSFPSAHPAKVNELYTGLEERLVEHAQYSKANALHQCRWRLCQLGLQGVEPDLDWSILSLLFSLAHRPLDTEYTPPSQRGAGNVGNPGSRTLAGRADLSSPDRGYERGSHGAQEDGSSSDDDGAREPWESASDLSDWSAEDQDAGDAHAAASDDQQGADLQQGLGHAAAKAGTRLHPHTTVEVWSQIAASASEARAAAGGQDSLAAAVGPSVGPARIAACPTDSLATCLAQARLRSRLPLAVLEPGNCCSDGYLAHQALALMLGSPSPAFAWQERAGRYLPCKGLFVPYLSTSQLHGVLSTFAEAGTQVRHLLSLTAVSPGDTLLQLPTALCSVGFHSPRLIGRKAVLLTPCLRAYLSAMHAQLERLSQALVTLQQSNLERHSLPSAPLKTGVTRPQPSASQLGPSVSHQRPLTLLELLDLCGPAMRRIRLLYTSTLAVMTALPGLPASSMDSPRPYEGASSGGGAAEPDVPSPSPRAGGALSAAASRAAARAASRTRAATTSEAGSVAPSPARSATAGGARPVGVPQLKLRDEEADVTATSTATQQPGMVAPQVSATLLQVLHLQLQRFGPLASPAHQSDHQALLHLYLGALVPLLEALDCWLCESDSQEDSLPPDFFIKPLERSIAETDPAYWSSAFTLVQQEAPPPASDTVSSPRTAGGSTAIVDVTSGPASPALVSACPSYLQPLAASILTAGKSLRLLRTSERRTVSANGSVRLGPGQHAIGNQAPWTADDEGPVHGWHGTSFKPRRSLVQAFLTGVHEQLSTPLPSGLAPGSVGPCSGAVSPSARPLAAEGSLFYRAAPSRQTADAADCERSRGGVWADAVGGKVDSGAALDVAPVSFFSLMASAGQGMSRLEPWSTAQKLHPGVLPPAPPSRWLPPWSLPTDAADPTSSSQRLDGQGFSTASKEWGAWPDPDANRYSVTPPRTPPIHKQTPVLCNAAAPQPASGMTGGALLSSPAQSASMDVSAPSTPSLGAPEPPPSLPQLSQQTGVLDQTGMQAGAAPVLRRPEPATGHGGGAVAGLDVWHQTVADGMAQWQSKLQTNRGPGSWVEASSAGVASSRTELQHLQHMLLPDVWQPGLTLGAPALRQQPGQKSSARWFPGGSQLKPASGSAEREPNAAMPVQQQLAWLLNGCQVMGQQLPPIDTVLQRCLLPLLQGRVEDTNQRLLGCMLSSWGLMAELVQVRNFYLLASPAMQAWATWLLSSLLRGKMVEEYQEHELEAALQEAIASSAEGDAPLPPLERVSVAIDHKRAARARDRQVEATRKTTASFATGPQATSAGGSAHPSERKQNHCLAELDGLQLRCQSTWLMAMIGGSHAMDSYSHAMVFLLQIQLAKLALEQARQRSWKLTQRHVKSRAAESGVAGGGSTGVGVLDVMYGQMTQQGRAQRVGAESGGGSGTVGGNAALLGQKAEEAVQQEMVNFVNNLHQFVMDRLLLNAWVRLERGLEAARSLDEVVALHKQFVAELDQQCGRGGVSGGTQKHVWAAIIRVLDQVVRFCSAHKHAAEAAEALAETWSSRVDGAAALSVGGSSSGGGALSAGGSAPRRGGLATRSQLQLQEQLGTARKVMADSAAQFSQLLLYLLRILHAATLKARSRTEFEQLLSRINHNGYYDPMILVAD